MNLLHLKELNWAFLILGEILISFQPDKYTMSCINKDVDTSPPPAQFSISLDSQNLGKS